MPRLMLPITDKENSVLRPLIHSVVKDLSSITHLPDDAPIIFPGPTEQNQQLRGALGYRSEDNRFGSESHLLISVRTRALEDQILTNVADRVGDQFTFYDDVLDIYARPARTFSEITISVEYRARSKADAQAWADEMKNKVSQGRASLIHEPAHYSYDVPEVALVILHELWRLREAKHGYGDAFSDWVLDRSSNLVTVTSNQVGSAESTALTVREGLERIQGSFDFPVEPEEGRYADGTMAWDISFNYTIHTDVVEAYVLQYPISVHNQLLGPAFVEHTTIHQDINRLVGWNSGQYYTHTFEAQRRMQAYVKNSGVNIPDHIDRNPRNIPFTIPVLTVLVMLYEPGEGDVLELLDITQLGKRKLAPYMVEYFKREAEWLTRPYMSPFIWHYYEDGRPMAESDNLIVATRDGKVKSTRPLDPRKVHYIRLSAVNNPSSVDPRAWARMAENVCVLKAYIHAICPAYDTSHIVSRRGECGPIGDKLIGDTIEDLIETIDGKRHRNGVMKTVGDYSVDAFFDPVIESRY